MGCTRRSGRRFNLLAIVAAVVFRLLLILTILVLVVLIFVLGLILILMILVLIVLHFSVLLCNYEAVLRLCKNSMHQKTQIMHAALRDSDLRSPPPNG